MKTDKEYDFPMRISDVRECVEIESAPNGEMFVHIDGYTVLEVKGLENAKRPIQVYKTPY